MQGNVDADPTAARLVAELAASMDEGSGYRTVKEAQEYLAQHLNVSHHHHGGYGGGGPGGYHGGGGPPGMSGSAAGAGGGPTPEQRLAALRNMLRKDLLPHVGTDPLKKALYLGHMVSRLIRCSIGLRPLDDRDSYVNKRLDAPVNFSMSWRCPHLPCPSGKAREGAPPRNQKFDQKVHPRSGDKPPRGVRPRIPGIPDHFS